MWGLLEVNPGSGVCHDHLVEALDACLSNAAKIRHWNSNLPMQLMFF
jgi:hypothetical protein